MVLRSVKTCMCYNRLTAIGVLSGPPRTTVVRLLFPSRPSAVLRSVRTIVIDPFDRQVRIREAHVGKEMTKRVLPTFADCYPSTPVVGVGFVVGIVAAF